MAGVVAAVRGSPLVDEVIVVSDGSTDDTTKEALRAGADRVLETPSPSGKGRAMRLAASQTKAHVLAFFDADLIGLRPDHVNAVILPVLVGQLAMNVGLRDKGPIINAIQPGLPIISGERAMRRAVFDAVPVGLMDGFKAEQALNHFAALHPAGMSTVLLPGVTMRRKFQKTGMGKALVDYLRLWSDILSVQSALRKEPPGMLARGSAFDRRTHLTAAA